MTAPTALERTPQLRWSAKVGWVRDSLWTVPAAVGVICASLYVTTDSGSVRSICFLLTAGTAIASILVGSARHTSGGPRFWRLMAACAALFVVGVLVRPWAVGQHGPAACVADLFTLAGYAACITGLLGIAGPVVRANSFALLDGLVTTVGGACAAVVLFILPALSVPGRPLWVSILAGLYPIIDMVIVLVILQLAFTSAVGTVSFLSLTTSLVMLVVGDTGYAWIGARGHLVGPAVMDLPFFGAYTLFAVAALHPTMTQLTTAVPRHVQPWSRRRLSLLLPASCVPALLVLLAPEHSRQGRAAEAAAILATSLLLIRRALTAVHRHVAAQQTLLYQSTHDSLTGLANRVAAVEQLTSIGGDRARPDAVLWAIALDLDNFRLVNDAWGSDIGDRLLMVMAQRFRSVADHANALVVARQGGDEFLFAGTAADQRDAARQARHLADRLRIATCEAVSLDDLEFVVTASAGVAVGEASTPAMSLLRNADTALGRAKSEGRDQTQLYDEAMSALVSRRLQLGTALRRALEADELHVAFQPIVLMESERVCGCEALARWTIPGEGPVSPAEFVPVAEESGLISDLGIWMLTRSVHTVAQWRRDGVVDDDFSVSVNVSPRQLTDVDFLVVVQEVLRHSGLPASCLTLEVTESVMLTNPETAIGLLERIRELGVRVSLDDFGTGYSSLSHLDRLPLNAVKLDRSFVMALDGADTIVRAVQGIATALKLKVVAEGIETRTQLQTLRALGISHGQGWLWGAAVPADAFEARWSLRTDQPATSS